MYPPITLYSLSSCEFCQKAKDYFEERNLDSTTIYVDRLFGEEYNKAVHILRKFAMDPAFPTIMIGEKAVVGFRPDEIEGLLAEAGQSA